MQQYEDGYTGGDMSEAFATFFSIGLFGAFFGIGGALMLVALSLF